MALAKLYLGAYEDALNLYRRSNELNRNYATGRFNYAATLVELGRLDEAKTEVKAALALNPYFTSGAIGTAPKAATARTPVLHEATPVGELSALLRYRR